MSAIRDSLLWVVAGLLLHPNAGGDKQPTLLDRIVDYLAAMTLTIPEIKSVSAYTLQPDEKAKPMVSAPLHCFRVWISWC